MSTDSSQSVDSEYVQATKQQVRNMVAEIAHLSKSDVAPAEFYEALLSRAISALVAVGGAVWTLNDEGQLEIAYQINLQGTGLGNTVEGQQQHYRLLHKALAAPDGMLVAPHAGAEGEASEEAGNPTDYLVIFGPLSDDRQKHGLVEIFQRPGAGPVTQRGYLRFLMQLCDLTGNYLNSRQIRHFEDRESLWGQLERFTKAVHQGLEPRTTSYTVVNEGRRLIECDRVSLAIRRGRKCIVEAISHQDQLDKRSNIVVLLSKLATRAVATGEAVWYTGKTDDMPPQVEEALHEYVDESHAKIVGILPLTRPSDDPDQAETEHPEQEVIGALIVEQFDQNRVENRMLQRVEVVQDHAASALANALEHDGIFLMPVWRTIGKWKWLVSARTLPKTLSVLAALLAIVLCLILVPAKLQLEASGLLRPAVRRNVYVREGGVVTDVFVEHDQQVKNGQPLAQLTSLDLEGRITEVLGLQRATDEQVKFLQNSLAGNKGRLTRGELDRMNGELMRLKQTRDSQENQLQLLDRKKQQLLITSPMDGKVITWDVHRRLFRRTVEPGQALMSVADPSGDWELEIFMRDDRIGHVSRKYAELTKDGKSMPVTYILATAPERDLTGGTVKEIQVSAEPRQEYGNSVLIVVDIKPDMDKIDPTELRDGIEVTAKVDCGYRSLGYVWFHDLIAFVHKKILFRL